VRCCSHLITLRSLADVNQVRTIIDVHRRSGCPLRLRGVATERAANMPVVGFRRPGRPVDDRLSPVVSRGLPSEETARWWATAVVCQRRPLYRPINGVSEMFIDIIRIVVVIRRQNSSRQIVSSDVTADDVIVKQVPGHSGRRPLSTQLYHVASPATQSFSKYNACSVYISSENSHRARRQQFHKHKRPTRHRHFHRLFFSHTHTHTHTYIHIYTYTQVYCRSRSQRPD